MQAYITTPRCDILHNYDSHAIRTEHLDRVAKVPTRPSHYFPSVLLMGSIVSFSFLFFLSDGAAGALAGPSFICKATRRIIVMGGLKYRTGSNTGGLAWVISSMGVRHIGNCQCRYHKPPTLSSTCQFRKFSNRIRRSCPFTPIRRG